MADRCGRYVSADDSHIEKSRSLSRLPFGSSSRKSGRPSTADSSLRTNDSSTLRADSEAGGRADEHAVLRKRTISGSDSPKVVNADVTFKPGQSVLEQIGEADHNGWMRKKGEHYNTWKQRYFVLKGPHLYYLRSNSKVVRRFTSRVSCV